MIGKKNEKVLALKLRSEGKTYNEILEVVPVAKSTLSLWLRSVGLSKPQKQRISLKKHAAQKRGGAIRKQDRINRTNKVVDLAKSDIGALTKRELLLIGAALYWAEGAKEKDYRPSVSMDFANSDPKMIKLYMKWLRTILNVENKYISMTVHVHKNRISELNKFNAFWLEVAGLPKSALNKTIVKNHKPKTLRKNTKDKYKGLVAIRVKRSTMMNRKVQGWIYGICDTI